MALKVWSSISSQDFNVAGNWTGGVPAGGDSMLFPAGTASCTVNVSNGATTYADIEVAEGYSNSLGSLATPFAVSLSGSFNIYASNPAEFYLSAGAANIAKFYNNPASTAVKTYLVTGTIVDTLVKAGIITSGATHTALVNSARDGLQANSNLELIGGTTTKLNNVAGNLVIQTAAAIITTLNHKSGLGKLLAGTFGAINQDGGKIDYRTTAGTPTVEVFGGTFMAAQDNQAKTITKIILHEAAKLAINSSVTVTNGVVDPLGMARSVYSGYGSSSFS